MAIQILGADGASVVGAEANSLAMRVSQRPATALSWNAYAAKSGALSGVAANAPVFAFRNIGVNLALLRNLRIGFIATAGFTSAQLVDFQLVVARAFSASDTGGTAIAMTGNNGKLRTSLATFSSSDMRIGALAAGTRTLDANPIGMAGGYAAAATPGAIIPVGTQIFVRDPGDQPLIMAQNEGFEIQVVTTLGAGGSGELYVNAEIAEVLPANWP